MSRNAKWVKGRNFDRKDRKDIVEINGTIYDGLKYCTNCLTLEPLIEGIRTETEYCPHISAEDEDLEGE